MKTVMTVLVVAAGLLVLISALFLIGILRGPANALEIVSGSVAVVASVVALFASVFIYRKVNRPI